VYIRFWSYHIDADSSQVLGVRICSYCGKDIQKRHRRVLRCSTVNIRHTEREWRDKTLYKSGQKCTDTFDVKYNIWSYGNTRQAFQAPLFLWYSSRQHRNVRFVRRLKIYEVTILKYLCIDFSGLKLTPLISRDKGSFILHGHNMLPFLLHIISFLCEEDTVHRD